MQELEHGKEWHLVDKRIDEQRTNALGHMRAAEYIGLFDEANSAFFANSGLTDENLVADGSSPVLMDLHACYLREVGVGVVVAIRAQHLEHDDTKLRVMLTMQDVGVGGLVATCELAIVNMSLETRRPVAWSVQQRLILERLRAAHATIPLPRQAGRSIRSFTIK